MPTDGDGLSIFTVPKDHSPVSQADYPHMTLVHRTCSAKLPLVVDMECFV